MQRPSASHVRTIGAVVVFCAMAFMRAAVAQATSPQPAFNGAADRTEAAQLLNRFDGTVIGLVVAAVVIIALLVWRVLLTIRRERTAAGPRQRRPQAEDSPTRPAMQAATDWGYDQNVRAAQVRAPVVVENANVDLPSIEHALTQWTISDVVKANAVAFVPDNALGKSPSRPASPYRTSFNPYFKSEQQASQMEVVEIADTLQQAELLVQLGDPKQAMTLLSHHIRETEKPGPAAWLMLLALYQSTGRESQYKALSDGFKLLFNAEVPPWATSPDVLARDLESYAQVMTRLQSTWSGPQAKAIVAGFLNDDRGGSRQGFSLMAYRELLFLAEILDTLDVIAKEAEEQLGIRRKLGPSS